MTNMDLTGETFGVLNVVGRNTKPYFWNCVCICGKVKTIYAGALVAGGTKSCGCIKLNKGEKIPVGKRVNHLVAIRESAARYSKSGRRYRRVECLCDCGRHKIIDLRHFNNGKYKVCSCGGATYSNLTKMDIKNWLVIKKEPGNTWLCRCTDCGTTRIFAYKNLKTKRNLLCGCKIKEKKVNANFVGEIYNDLVVIENIYTTSERKRVKCLCSCGNTIITTIYQLKGDITTNCGCLSGKEKYNKEKENLKYFVGRKFGRLLVLHRCAKRFSGKLPSGKFSEMPRWVCLCTCGKTKVVLQANLINSNVRSCGCLQFEIAYQGKSNFTKKEKSVLNKLRNTMDYKNWRIAVIARDKSICDVCGKITKRPKVHHLLSFSKHIEMRFNKNNGVTLCTNCHTKFHTIYSSINFSIQDYIKFKNGAQI